MFIVIDIDFPERLNRAWVTKQEARDYLKCCAEICKRSVAGFRIYDTERHVTIKLVPKKRVVWEASIFDSNLRTYRRLLFRTSDLARDFLETEGADRMRWRTRSSTGGLHVRCGQQFFDVRPKEVR